MPKKGKPLRPVSIPSIGKKKFKRAFEARRRSVKLPLHPTLVCADSRSGSLDSLAGYLRKNSGIPDHEVALELRKLLDGSPACTPFRIVVVDHPDAPRVIDCRQEDLADTLGVSRVAVGKALKKLEKEGLIGIGYGKIALVDRGRLSQRIEVEQAQN